MTSRCQLLNSSIFLHDRFWHDSSFLFVLYLIGTLLNWLLRYFVLLIFRVRIDVCLGCRMERSMTSFLMTPGQG